MSSEGWVAAPLYVQYVPKKDEYRIHVFSGEVIFKQRKTRNKEVADPNWKVRNHKNGFIFVHKDVEPPEDVVVQALGAVKALGLTFGAVDVIWNDKQQKAYVLEVNTAPGLEGATVEAYGKAIIKEVIK